MRCNAVAAQALKIKMIECFKPIFDNNCKLLVLGSCPSVKSLQKAEYYGHKQNRFWRVIFGLLGEDFTDDYESKKQMLLRHGIGLWDTIGSCKRDGSLDSNITVVVPNDVASLVKNSGVKCIALNGGKAKQIFLQFNKQFVNNAGICADLNDRLNQNSFLQTRDNLTDNDEMFFTAGGKKIKLVFLPSTSPANARMNFDTLFEIWQKQLSEFINSQLQE